ncbi:MAG: hypothetical protein EOP59_00555 [Sphingomonadales bacterium]|nr:MAG: hypothetical protein EOP59_00555 [Sphingomonadales bacterium]
MHSEPLPRPFGVLLAEQVRTVRLALRWEILLAAAALVVIGALIVMMGLRYQERLDLTPEILQPALIAALVLPFRVWKSDPVFEGAFLWTLPVRRQHAAMAKLIAGAAWLLAAMLALLATLAIAALATGGSFGIEETRAVASANGASAAQVRWTTPVWTWLVPFGAALMVYLFSSAAVLGLRYPLRWSAGLMVLGTLILFLASGIASDGAVEHIIGWFRDTVMIGRYGLDFALNAGEGALSYWVDDPGPGGHRVWTALPVAGQWAMALIVWLGIASLALAAAIRRHWER